MKDNVVKTDYGYNITWAKTDSYTSKILVFEHIGNKTPIFFQSNTEKSWFVNNGMFRVRWIDTKSGKLYENQIQEGSVFHVQKNMPVSLESLQAGASISQTANIDDPNDFYCVIPGNNIEEE